MKPDKIGPGWYETAKWRIVYECRNGVGNCPQFDWYVHPLYGGDNGSDSLGPFRTLREAIEAVGRL